MYFQYTNLFSQIYNPLNSTKYNPGRWFLSSVRMHACVWVCVCVRACTHAAGGSGNPPRVFKHKPGLLLPSLWSKPFPGGDPTLEDCDFLAHETHFRRGRGGGALCLASTATHLHPQDRMEQDRTFGSLPQSWHGYCSREWPAVEFKRKETPFSPLQPPLWHSRAPLHATYAPRSALRSRGLPGSAGRRVSGQQPAPRPAPCGRRGLATLLLDRQWVRTLLDSALWQPAVPRSRSWKHQHSKSCRSRWATQMAPVMHIFTWGGMFSHSFVRSI